jgi:hypothetical protein
VADRKAGRAGENRRPAVARTMGSHLVMLVLQGKDRKRRTMQRAVHHV